MRSLIHIQKKKQFLIKMTFMIYLSQSILQFNEAEKNF